MATAKPVTSAGCVTHLYAALAVTGVIQTARKLSYVTIVTVRRNYEK